MNTKELVRYYFDISNQSDFEEIEKLFTEASTYSAQHTGLYLGVKDIISMQKKFHGSFDELEWKVIHIQEEKDGIVRVDFDFQGIQEGKKVEFSGIEYIVIVNETIQHIEIKNK